MRKDPTPPRWAQRFLAWYCRPEVLEDLQGDLNEYFARNLVTKGRRRAKLIYVIDVFKFFRPYTVRQLKLIQLLIHWIMIGSYIKTSGRNIARNKLFSAINIIGLAISMSVGLLMIGVLSDMNAYDQFHTNKSRIYRVISKYQYLDQADNSYYASTSLRTGKAIAESIPGIDEIAVLFRGFEGDMKAGETVVPLSGLWSNESVFRVFTFPLVTGNPATALKEPFSVVLTETSALKLFGGKDPMGKGVTLTSDKNGHEYIVTGVIKDLPVFSHMRFDVLASLSSRQVTEKANKFELSWENIWNGYVYLLLPERTNLQTVQRNLDSLSVREDRTVKNTTIKLALQPLSEIALGEDLNNSIGPVMAKSNVWIIGILTFVVILSACFNYTNLSIARALRRSREVGIRKVVGALKSQVVTQFMTESVMIALFSLLFSFVIFLLVKPYFLSLEPNYQRMLQLNLSGETVLYFILLAIAVGILAGSLPAFFFARINAISVLKNRTRTGRPGNFTLRQGLIVVQFTVSLMFIAATLIGYKQFQQILAFNLGYKTENILNINLQGNKADRLTKVLGELPEIHQLSASMVVTSVGGYWGSSMKYKNPQDSTFVNYNTVNENYLPLHGHQLLSGRNFISQPEASKVREVIVNEKILKRFNIGEQDPMKAIGEEVLVNKKPAVIVGVVKDFQYGRSTDKQLREVLFLYSPNEAQYINAELVTTDWPATREKIEKAWKEIDNVHPLEAKFYDDEIEQSYSDFSSRIKVIGTLSFLAICIASIGLLGMVVFTTETRLKEICIRKVLGASEGNLLFLLSKGFLLLLFLSALIAWPSTHYFFSRYALGEYSDSTTLAFGEFIIGMVTVGVIALLMIGSQTLKATRSNPAEVLKNE